MPTEIRKIRLLLRLGRSAQVNEEKENNNVIVEVVPYRAEWKEMFREEAERIRGILGDELVRVFHIGSTSVPGIQAKPVIDLMPVVRDIQRLDAYDTEFMALGYESMGEYGIPGRRFYRKGGERRTHHIHAFQYDNAYGILRHASFCAYLRAFPAVRDEYAALKAGLAKQFPADIEAYCDGKDAFVKQVEREALLWYWNGAESLL